MNNDEYQRMIKEEGLDLGISGRVNFLQNEGLVSSSNGASGKLVGLTLSEQGRDLIAPFRDPIEECYGGLNRSAYSRMGSSFGSPEEAPILNYLANLRMHVRMFLDGGMAGKISEKGTFRNLLLGYAETNGLKAVDLYLMGAIQIYDPTSFKLDDDQIEELDGVDQNSKA